MYDMIEKSGQSVIQHGPNNNRIYLMKLHKADYPGIIPKLNMLAEEKKYTKIFVKIPEWGIDHFQNSGYIKEAYIPKFYNGKTDAYFFSRFLDKSRSFIDEQKKYMIDKNINIALSKQKDPVTVNGHSAFFIRQLDEMDAVKITDVYSKVFRSYPFPVFEENYIRRTMTENVLYYGAWKDDRLIAASSAEIDFHAENAEMTDFATDPEFAGNHLALFLLREMEREMHKRGIKTLYTIARSFSPAMNITFAKSKYQYSGTLKNNTDISGKIESMNIWYKLLK